MKMKKPNGTILDVSENSIPYALSLGWAEVKPKAESKPKKAKKAK